jgi:signal transduction histidine kinase
MPSLHWGLSARLLALTTLFVMLAEVLIYVPSVSRFRKSYLEDQIAKANLAILAVEASPDNIVGKKLSADLLLQAGAHGIVLKEPERRMLMLSEEMPPSVDVTFDLRHVMFWEWIGEAMMTLLQPSNRVMRVVAASPHNADATIEVVMDETPMRRAMLDFSVRILQLSIIISLFTAGLVFLSLQWLMVRPILQITDSMTRFRTNPEDESVTIQPSERTDEIGVAQRELSSMQEDLRGALRHKTHLAALGAAVAKINHDLRNTLSTAVLTSEHLASIDDPEVARVAPRLAKSIDRAVALCSQTLEFVQDVGMPFQPTVFHLNDLVSDLETAVCRPSADAPGLETLTGIGLDFDIKADPEQLFRALNNLALNAAQAGARTVQIRAIRDTDLVIEFRDDGPGIAESVQERLFQPFAGTARKGGTGLGLVIAREIINAHGGDLTLGNSDPGGTTFIIRLPASCLHPTGS